MNAQGLSTRQIMNRIYKDVCGFDIPKTEEKEVRQSKGSPIYGEIKHQALNQLLDYLALDDNDVFVDLGSGVGKVVLHTALVTPVKKSIGIELSTTRFLEAKEALKRASQWSPHIKSRCAFKNADLMKVNLSKATVIYTCSTAFSMSFMKKVAERLATFTHDFRLVSPQELPQNKHFHLIDTLRLDMSWSRKIAVNIYQRV